MRKIILLVGPPAVGKSTWALEEVRKSGSRFKRVNLDELRAMYGVTSFNPKEEKLIKETMYSSAERFLSKGYDILADNTNLSSVSWTEWNEVAARVGDCTVEEKHFDNFITLKELKRRNSERSRVVPEDVIERMYNKWKNFKSHEPIYHPKRSVLDLEIPFAESRSKKKTIIVDIDGTLAYNTNRGIFEWDKVYTDDVNIVLDTMLMEHFYSEDVKVFFITGRNDVCYEETKRWLLEKTWLGLLKKVDWELIMKPEAINNTKDFDFKKSVYNERIKGKYKVIAIFEDRKKVVEMWRSLNLPVYQVYNGDF